MEEEGKEAKKQRKESTGEIKELEIINNTLKEIKRNTGKKRGLRVCVEV